jgi:hypothetical protein
VLLPLLSGQRADTLATRRPKTENVPVTLLQSQ